MLTNNLQFGLNERDIDTLFTILSQYTAVTKVNIFGSRAKGTHKPSSDIDLAIMNEGITDQMVLHLNAAFGESTLPYKVDLVNYPTLTHADLKEHIERAGLPFYLAASA